MIETTPTIVPRSQASQELDPSVAIPKTNGTLMSSTPSTFGVNSCQRFHVFISKTSLCIDCTTAISFQRNSHRDGDQNVHRPEAHLSTSDQQYTRTVFVFNDRTVDFHLT